MSDKEDVKKIIPSKLERGLQQFLYRFGKYIPEGVTPNQVTAVGALGGLFAVICLFLCRRSPLFFIGVILGIVIHIVADDLDGFVARRSGMTSKAGAYFDLITDVMFSTFFLLALGFSGYAQLQIVIFLVPGYALIIVTMMNYILYLKEFLFPRVGPVETHLVFLAVCIGSLVFGNAPLFTLPFVGLPMHFADIVLLLSILPVYIEMVRLQIQLFKRLKAMEANDE